MNDTNAVADQVTVVRRERSPYNLPRRAALTVYRFLASSKLAMFLLSSILLSCVVGVSVFRGARAWSAIFGTLWFNGLLVLLVVNVACCFFGRLWGRKMTVVTFGMAVFHLSFVTMFIGIVYGSLFSFTGSLRLTEGETLPNGSPESYDVIRFGRFFTFDRLKGATTLDKMQVGYTVDGKDKRVAYDISLHDGGRTSSATIYTTNKFTRNGISYFRDKEGYSPMIVLSDRQGNELYSAYVSLQSLKQKSGGTLYTSGSKTAPGSFPFPQAPDQPLFALQMSFVPSKLVERGGEAYFQLFPLHTGTTESDRVEPLAQGKATVGESFDAGQYRISLREVRYWGAMTVRYDPGKPLVLGSLWVGLGGMVITTIGRIRGNRKKTRAA